MPNKPISEAELLKEFEDNYIEYTDAGVMVYFTGKNDGECGVDLDDFIKFKLQEALSTQLEEIIAMVEANRRNNEEEIANDDWAENYNEALDDLLNQLIKQRNK